MREETKFSEIIHNPHFNNLAVILNIPFHSGWWKQHNVDIPFKTLWRNFDKVTDFEAEFNRSQVVEAFTELIVSVTKSSPSLLYTKEDLNWFFGILDDEDGQKVAAILALFKAWVVARHTFLTPGQVAEITGKSQSNYRNRAAGRQGYQRIPGCRNPGKDWLIPLAVLQAEGEIPWSYRHEDKEI